MTTGVGGNEFQSTLDEARALLATARNRSAVEAEPVTSEVADGAVTVEMRPDGDLTAITVDPQLLREGLEVICEHIVEAVNAGHQQLRTQAMAGAGLDADVDVDAVNVQLQELQEQSVRQMEAFGAVLSDVVKQLRDEGQR